MDGGLKMLTIILAALLTGFWLGVWATHVNFVRPVHEVEAGLRKELGEVRKELLVDERLLALAGQQMFGSEHSVAHFEIVEPTIEHRDPSDVFFFNNFEDLL